MAVDGSEASDSAFEYVSRDIMKTKRDFKEGDEHPNLDKLVVGTITDQKKESYLPFNMKAQYLTESYEAKILTLGHYGRFASREVSDVMTTKECLWELAEFEQASIIVVGNHGRKGPKKDETVCGT